MTPNNMMLAEKVLTWLGAWGALRFGGALVIAVLGSILFLELLTPSLARLLPGVAPNRLHFFVVSIGLLLGLIGHFVAGFWDRAVFAHWYGPRGLWLDRAKPPLWTFPPGTELKRLRALAVHALSKRPELDDQIDRELMRVAQRQLERWERIEHPLILGGLVRGLLWPSLFAAALALVTAALASAFGPAAAVAWLLLASAAYGLLALLVLVPFTHLRVEFHLRLYQDVAAHPAHHTKRKSDSP
jgi:hypothetical protein